MKRKLSSLISLFVVLALLPAFVPGGATPTTAQAQPAALAPDRAQAAKALRSSPVMFIENVGQFDERARFQVRGAQATVHLTTDAENVELVGQIGGGTAAVAVQSSYAYIGVGPRVEVLDVSDASNPILVGRTDVLPGSVSSIAVAGNTAYVTTGNSGLCIFDIANPESPVAIGRYDTPGQAYDVVLAGSQAYIADGTAGLHVVNVADPQHPTGTGHCDTPGRAYDVAVVGGYAYVADDEAGLRIIDISDAQEPVDVGSYQTQGQAWGVDVQGALAYIAEPYIGFDSGLRIVSVADPQAPREVGFLATPWWARDVVVVGSLAYMANGDAGLRIIDVADPENPRLVAYCMTGKEASDVEVLGGIAYVADGGLRIVNVVNPAYPISVGGFGAPGSAWDVEVRDNTAYYASGLDGGLEVVDVSDPDSPVAVGHWDAPQYSESVAVQGDHAYIATRHRGLRVISIVDSANPVEVGYCDTPGAGWSVAVSGTYAYFGDGPMTSGGEPIPDSLRIISIADPVAPVEVGFLEGAFKIPWNVSIHGSHAYVADYDLVIIDVSDPTHPSVVSHLTTPGSAYDVAIQGAIAYVADGSEGLRLVDISDATWPREISYYDTPGIARGVTVSGEYAYIADGEAGLHVVNVADPAHLASAGFYDSPGWAFRVAVSDDYLHVADGGGGLLILRFTGGPEPTYSVSGRVTDATGNPIPSVTISDGAGHTATTDSNGDYTLSGLAAGTYTITPSKSGYTFSPPSRTVSVPPDATGKDFEGSSISTLPTVTTLPPSEPTLTSATLNGTVNPNGLETNAWFEWGIDPNLTVYTPTSSLPVGSETESVAMTATLPISIGVPYYYRVAAQNAAGLARDENITRTLVLLGNDPTDGKDPYWNRYDRLIHFYAHAQDLPATIVKAIIAHESGGLGTNNCNPSTGRCNPNSQERPDRAFLYEPIGVDEQYVQKKSSAYSQYRLPLYPPPSGNYPYNPYWGLPVQIISGTTNLDMICYVCSYKKTDACATWRELCNKENWWSERYDSSKKTYYQQLWGLTHPGGTPTEQFVAQYRLASSYGLGQLLYWFHHDRINDQAPEVFYDPEANIRAMIGYLDNRRQVCAPRLGRDDLDLQAWKPTVQAYNSNTCSYSYPGFWSGVQLHFPLTQPALAPEDFDASQILSPTLPAGLMAVEAASAFPSPGEYEVDRLVADVKGTGQLQLVTLYAVVSNPAIGVDYGKLKVFSDEAGSTVEWESPPMEGVLAAGVVFTDRVPGGGAPIIGAMWGAGAHGSRLYPFRWDGQTFLSIWAVGPDEERTFGFFGDAGVGIVEGQVWVGGRDGAQPLSVFHVATYEWEASTQTFDWVGEEVISNATYGLYLPLILHNR